MPVHSETRILPYTAEQMYAIVADIERYPEFLPWCEGLRILQHEKYDAMDIAMAEMRVAFHALREIYVSRVKLDRNTFTIDARHVRGPFKRLDTNWRFVPLAKGTEVHFRIDFAFKSMILSAAANLAFGYVASRMTGAFVDRAAALHGSHNLQK